LLRIHEGIEQRHTGESNGELLRGFDLGLGLLVDPLPLNVELFFDGSGGARQRIGSPGAWDGSPIRGRFGL
jgi:hypothetical protein